jgi:hypothetical protein
MILTNIMCRFFQWWIPKRILTGTHINGERGSASLYGGQGASPPEADDISLFGRQIKHYKLTIFKQIFYQEKMQNYSTALFKSYFKVLFENVPHMSVAWVVLGFTIHFCWTVEKNG